MAYKDGPLSIGTNLCPITKDDVARTRGKAFMDLTPEQQKACGGASGEIYTGGLAIAWDVAGGDDAGKEWIDPEIKEQENRDRIYAMGEFLEMIGDMLIDLPWQLWAVFGGIVALTIATRK